MDEAKELLMGTVVSPASPRSPASPKQRFRPHDIETGGEVHGIFLREASMGPSMSSPAATTKRNIEHSTRSGHSGKSKGGESSKSPMVRGSREMKGKSGKDKE